MFTKHDEEMFAKGYRYRFTPLDKSFEPLYCKSPADAGDLLRDYPHKRFDVVAMAWTRRCITIDGHLINPGELLKIVIWDVTNFAWLVATAYRPDGTEVTGPVNPLSLNF